MKKILIILPHLKEGAGLTEFVHQVYPELAQKFNYKIDIITETVLSGAKIPNFPETFKITNGPSITHAWKYFKFWNKVAKKASTYDYVHFHTDSLTKFYPYFVMRKKNNVIVHSHNATNKRITSSRLKSMLHKIGMRIIRNSSFRKFACSDIAAQWLFGNGNYFQVNNAIDLKKFKYDDKQREKLIKELALQGKVVYGHVGRFLPVKNHEKLIGIFHEIHAQQGNAVLLLFGNGENQGKIKNLVNDLDLQNSVYFTGFHSDLNVFLNVIDGFIFPSFSEGLGTSLIEAQANGIPVFFSDVIPHRVKILPNSQLFSLQETDHEIATKILNTNLTEYNRTDAIKMIADQGYELSDLIMDIDEFYSTYDHSDWSRKTIYKAKIN